MAISADQVKALRDATGAGMMDSKRALEATNGDIEKAKDWLRLKGIAKAGTKSTRTAREGIIATYVHHNHQLGVLLDQPFAKDDKRTVDQMLKEAIAKLGENITISRFARFKVGEAS